VPDDHYPVVLIVDDERIIADTLALILARSGFATFTAYSASSAMEMAAVVPPQLLISDVLMPGMTGVELAILLVKAVPDCKIILFSGQAATADLLAEAYQSGHDFTILSKPVHPADLLRHIAGCFQPCDDIADPNSDLWQPADRTQPQMIPAIA
jgi:CheY-like chemotaxis protein